MSFNSLLIHRCWLYDLTATDSSGSQVYRYQRITESPIPCRLDFNFIRQGKDPMWIAASARPDDRTGVMFFGPKVKLKSGMRVSFVDGKGPKGFFELKGAIDEVWGMKLHHYEVGAMEVSTLQARRNVIQDGPEKI